MSHRDARTTTPGRYITRLALIVAAVSVLVAAIIFVGSHEIPATYSSSADVLVSVSGTDATDTSQGADNLASQYAEQVTATQVLTNAGKALGINQPIPSSKVSAGVVAAQNVIEISASYSDPVVAQKVTAAVATAFVDYVNEQVNAQAAKNEADAQAKLKPLEQQVARLQREETAALNSKAPNAAAKASSISNLLSTVQAQVSAAQAQIASASQSGRASLSVVSSAGLGSQTAPKPKLYAMVGFVIALLIALRFAVVAYRKKFPKPAAPAGAAPPTMPMFVSEQRLLSPPSGGQGMYLPGGMGMGPGGAGGAEMQPPHYFVVDGDVVTPVVVNDPSAVHYDAPATPQPPAAPVDVVPETGSDGVPSYHQTPAPAQAQPQASAQRQATAQPQFESAPQPSSQPAPVAQPPRQVTSQVEAFDEPGDQPAAVPPWRAPAQSEQQERSQSKLARESAIAFGAAVLAGTLFPRRRGRGRGGRR